MADKLVIELVLEPSSDKKAFSKVEDQAQQSGKKAGSEFGSSFGGAIGASLKGVAKNFLTIAVAVGVLKTAFDTLKEGVGNFIEFQKGVAEINSILPQNQKLTRLSTQAIQEFSTQFGSSNRTQARAFYNIVSAGVKGTAKQLETLEVANKAAVAGLVDIDQAAKVIVSSVNAYSKAGLTAKEASDALFVAVREGQTTFQELADFIGNTTGIAANAGVDFNELAGALAFVTKSGLATDVAATGLRQVFVSVIKPTKEAADEAKRLGIEFNTAAIRSKGLAGFLKDIQQQSGGSEKSLAKLFGNVRALAPVLNIVNGNFKEFNRILDETKNSAGATEQAFDILAKTLSLQLDQAGEEFKLFGQNISSFLIPSITEITSKFRTFFNFINEQFRDDTPLEKLNNDLLKNAEAIANVKDRLQTLKGDGIGDTVAQFFLTNDVDGSIKKLEGRLDSLLIKGREIVAERQNLANASAVTNQQRVENEKATTDEIVKANQEALNKLGNIGLTREQQLQAEQARQLEILRKSRELKLIQEEEFNLREKEVRRVFAEQIQAINDQQTLNSVASFENIGKAFKVLGRNVQVTAGQIAKISTNVLANGLGRAFDSVGRSIAEGRNAFTAFAEGIKSIFGDLASALGDYYIKTGVAQLASTGGAKGGETVAAGAALKIFGGILGAAGAGGGASGGGAAAGNFSDGTPIDQSAALDQDNIQQAQEDTNVQLVVQGSIFNTQETANALTDLLNENFDTTGASLTGARLI
jgi:TP901 family phage tail tape measure protein